MYGKNYASNLIWTDLKRLKHYIAPILISVSILLCVCAAAGSFISRNVYREQTFNTIRLAYYLPDDDDKRYNMLALGMLEKMNSIQESAELIQVDSIETGYRLLEQNDVLFFIVVPDNFFSGIMDSTNPPLDIIVKNRASISSYVANELFLAYAGYLGTAQAGIYSALDTARAHELEPGQIAAIQDRVNLIYLDHALNKDHYIKTEDATSEGQYTLLQHYIASALMLSLFFMTFMLAPLIGRRGNGVLCRFKSYKINAFHVFISNMICTVCALYIAYLPCFFGISLWQFITEQQRFYPLGLITILPAILAIALIINIINVLCDNQIVNHMAVLIITLGITYIGGGILPPALLPSALRGLSPFLPGEHIMAIIGHSLFGI